ncbi:MAG: hypothetical protein QNJ90_16690 [Planctomycetota bacterium]|nr:hypothetical protein [Planctomycetota bacterium]
MYRALLVIALVALALVAAPSAAAERSWADRVAIDIVAARLEQLLTMLTDEALDGISSEAPMFQSVAYRLDRYGAIATRHDAKTAGAIFALVAERATRLRADAGDGTAWDTAWAYATSAHCRHRLMTGEREDQPAWVEAAECLVNAPGSNDERRLLAARWLAESAAGARVEEKARLGRARALLEETVKSWSDAEKSAVARARGHAERARSLMARKALNAAKKEITGGIACLAPHLGCEKPSKPVAETQALLASLNAEKRLKVKGAAFRTTSIVSGCKTLTLELPDGGPWVREHEAPFVLALQQRTLDGFRRRTIRIASFKSTGTIAPPEGPPISSSSPKGLAADMFPYAEQLAGMDELIRKKRAKKKRLHKSLSDVYAIEVEGRGSSGDWKRVWIYFFKSKKLKRTYQMFVNEFQNDDRWDGATEFVLMNLRANVK